MKYSAWMVMCLVWANSALASQNEPLNVEQLPSDFDKEQKRISDTIARVPDVVMDKIGSYLDKKDLGNLSKSSKLFNDQRAFLMSGVLSNVQRFDLTYDDDVKKVVQFLQQAIQIERPVSLELVNVKLDQLKQILPFCDRVVSLKLRVDLSAVSKLTRSHSPLQSREESEQLLREAQRLRAKIKEIGPEGAKLLGQHKDHLTRLRFLDVSGHIIGDDGAAALAELAGLKHLNLSLNNISDTGVAAIAKLTGLESLNLLTNPVGDSGVRAIIGALKKLKSLSLSSKPNSAAVITADSFEGLPTLKELEYLFLNNIPIQDPGMLLVSQVPSLKTVKIIGAGITSSGLSDLRKLVNLNVIDLSNNSIDNHGLIALVSLGNIQHLSLNGNLITDEITEYLDELIKAGMDKSFTVDLRDNALSYIAQNTLSDNFLNVKFIFTPDENQLQLNTAP